MKRMFWACLGAATLLSVGPRSLSAQLVDSAPGLAPVTTADCVLWPGPPVNRPVDPQPRADVHYQILPMVLRVVRPDGRETICVRDPAPAAFISAPITPATVDNFGAALYFREYVHELVGDRGNIVCFPPVALDPIAYGVTCPYLVARDQPPAAPPLCLPDALANVQRLLQADRLLKCGAGLMADGRFGEAVDCFQAVQRLVPGTNLEERANTATQQVLVRVFGTTTEAGLVDEPAEPEKESSAFACDKCPHCSKANASACSEKKPKTAVYPVADLLGRGKETRSADLDDVMNVIATTVEPKSWAENGGDGTMECYYRSRAIVIRQTPEIHEQIAELLDGLRQARVQSEMNNGKSHRPSLSNRAVQTGPAKTCCDECCAKDQCEKDHACTTGRGCCDECCSSPVLTLPADAATSAKGLGLELEVIADPPPASAAPGLYCVVGGTCAEAAAADGDLRVRWQIPVGPLTVLVRYEHRQLTVGVGTIGARDSAGAEESENPR